MTDLTQRNQGAQESCKGHATGSNGAIEDQREDHPIFCILWHKDGRRYYVYNQCSRVATWNADQSTLVAYKERFRHVWKEYMDAETAERFYFNLATGESEWQTPRCRRCDSQPLTHSNRQDLVVDTCIQDSICDVFGTPLSQTSSNRSSPKRQFPLWMDRMSIQQTSTRDRQKHHQKCQQPNSPHVIDVPSLSTRVLSKCTPPELSTDSRVNCFEVLPNYKYIEARRKERIERKKQEGKANSPVPPCCMASPTQAETTTLHCRTTSSPHEHTRALKDFLAQRPSSLTSVCGSKRNDLSERRLSVDSGLDWLKLQKTHNQDAASRSTVDGTTGTTNQGTPDSYVHQYICDIGRTFIRHPERNNTVTDECHSPDYVQSLHLHWPKDDRLARAVIPKYQVDQYTKRRTIARQPRRSVEQCYLLADIYDKVMSEGRPKPASSSFGKFQFSEE